MCILNLVKLNYDQIKLKGTENYWTGSGQSGYYDEQVIIYKCVLLL